jgi:sugar/nucleoside kinase (ribokinase family)
MSSTKTFDLLVIGDANPDVILGPLDGPLAFGQREQVVETGMLTLGGSGAITACGAARLGLRVAFAGRVGDDESGRFVRDALTARGVDTDALRTDPDLPTPLTAVVTRGADRAMLTSPGALAAVSDADVPDALLTASRHVHVSSYFLMPLLAKALTDLLRTARSHGATTSLDTNDDPSGEWDLTVLSETFPEVDFLLPNAAEAGRLAGPAATSLEAAAKLLAGFGPLVVVKNGADGAFSHDGTGMITTAGIKASPVDTVGAGDSFNAGLLAAVLRGLSRRSALGLAAVCGALSTRAHGGTPAQSTWDEALVHFTRNDKDPS